MTIRPLRPDEPVPWDLLLDADPARAMVERYLDASEVFVLEQEVAADGESAGGERVIGVLALLRLGRDHSEPADSLVDSPALAPDAPADGAEYEIKNIAVADDHQGRGHGRRLLAFAIDHVRARGARRLHIGTGNSSIGQLALYQKVGFRIVAIDRDFFTRHYPEPLHENGIPCRDMLRLVLELS